MVKRLEGVPLGPTVTSMTYAEERKEEAKIIMRNERTQEEVAALEEEKAAEREKVELEAKAIEEEKERRKVLRELRAKKRELQRRAAAEEQAKREKQAAAAAEMTQHQSQSGEQESQPSVPTATATPETSSGSTEPPRIDPNDPAFPDALIRTGSVSEPPEPDDDDEETTEVDENMSQLSQILEVVVPDNELRDAPLPRIPSHTQRHHRIRRTASVAIAPRGGGAQWNHTVDGEETGRGPAGQEDPR
ncbi:hypothetical protein Pelo_16119 [Pelomyxa schiedti]|nr:hypothetical protein Pelo_16119 [Pelomyxa schiedti]